MRDLSASQTVYRELITTLVDAETGERGYVITGEPAFLEPYTRAQQRIESALQSLPRAAAGQPREADAARASEIDNLYTRWKLTVAEPVIAARRRHPVVLQEFASDVPARHGGEEFVLVLSGMAAEAAMARAEIIRSHIEQLQVSYHRQTLGSVTVSIGVASFPDHAGDPNELLATTDRARYRAKHEGRNRVCIAELKGGAHTDRG